MLRLDESSPLVQAYYKKKAEEERANNYLHRGTPPGKKKLYAKGRKKPGTLNKTEQSYQDYLESERRCGRILAYWYEAVKLKIAEGTCWYTPDFMVMRPDGELELHEVKGSPRIFQDDAKVNRLFVVYPRSKKDGGGWETQEF